VRVKCLAQEHNTVSPARAPTRTAQSGDEHTNHEAKRTWTTILLFHVTEYVSVKKNKKIKNWGISEYLKETQ